VTKSIGRRVVLKSNSPQSSSGKIVQFTAFLLMFLCPEHDETVPHWQLCDTDRQVSWNAAVAILRRGRDATQAARQRVAKKIRAVTGVGEPLQRGVRGSQRSSNRAV
jgi:hypothetical protein